jgi:DNA-directed RNA polymerase I, II, and III subunit RPABC2
MPIKKSNLNESATVIDLSKIAKKLTGSGKAKNTKNINDNSDSDESDTETENSNSDSEYNSDEESDDQEPEFDENKNNEIDEDDLLGDEDNDEDNEKINADVDEDNIISAKKNKTNEDDEDGDDEVDEEELNLDCLMNSVEDEDVYVEPEEAIIKISQPKLTKYERVRILGARTKQLALGAPPLVKNVSNKSPIEIAEIELMLNMIPFKIKRPLPNNTYEIWKLSELEK